MIFCVNEIDCFYKVLWYNERLLRKEENLSLYWKIELSYYAKIYDEDVALNSIRCPDNRYDLTHNLENIVYNELIYMGY